MLIHQFYDKGLAHASYAIISAGQMALIDPSRDPRPYLALAQQHEANIVVIIETHPHADFVSSHLEIHQLTGATIYTSQLTGASYPHREFDDGKHIDLGNVRLEAINTPGHSPDSISVLLYDQQGDKHAVFTGDTLFVGDVGRPDLRERVGNITAKAESLARQLYHSTREKLMKLPPDVLVYPAHGPGSLCGKNMGTDLYSTIGREIRDNYALQSMSEDEFATLILAEQPFVPKYFPYDVMLNKSGATPFQYSIDAIPTLTQPAALEKDILVIDGRQEDQFKASHLPNAINIPDGLKFETWLGSVVNPGESFYLLAENDDQSKILVEKAAKIGYEQQVKALVISVNGQSVADKFDMEDFKQNIANYTIVDIRNDAEVKEGLIFENALHIPLPRLRENTGLLPRDKPIVIHCAGGYRSAIGSSIVASAIPDTVVLDMGASISNFATVH